MANQISAPRGTKDVSPSEVYKFQFIEDAARSVAEDFGFKEIRFPTFEHTELFLRGVGDTTDVVQKEMYTFEDKGGRSITLRPEGTASVVRSFLENSLYGGGLPVKTYYLAPNFRYEKPQAGRLREHHQFGVECFGAEGPQADAEVIDLAKTYMDRLGIKDVRLEINSLGCPECRPAFQQALREHFAGRENELCETCRDRLERNPLRILDCKSKVCQEISKGAPVGLDYLCSDCRDHFETLKGYLDAMGIEYSVNPNIVRGLDYYTRTVFEYVSTDIGAKGTVCGGGRYDGLVTKLGGAPVPALGFGSGIERMLLVMEFEGAEIPEPEGYSIFIAAMGERAELEAQVLVSRLRKMGVSAQRDICSRGLKAQMKYAGKTGAKFSAVLGDNEIDSGRVTVKNMATGGQADCGLDALEIKNLVQTETN